MAYDYDVLVIGAGPGGYVAAIRASQLGLKAAVIERDKPGGVCLNWGCIPSKSLIHQAEVFRSISELEGMGLKVDQSGFDYQKVYAKSRAAAESLSKGVQFLLKKNQISLISGEAKITGANEVTLNDGSKHTAKNILIATGARPRQIPSFSIDEKRILTSTGILMLEALPKRMLVLGSGAIGMEFAFVMNAFGVEVHVVEMLDRVLPIEDEEASQIVQKSFQKRGIKFSTGTKASSVKDNGDSFVVTLEGKGEALSELETDTILVAVGRAPNTENLGLENVGVETDRGFITIKDYYQTTVPSIYAIGDVVNSPLLAHVASKEGEIAVEHMAGHNPEVRLDPLLIPGATYCEPQIASFGYPEWKAKEEGIKYEKAVFPYRGAGKSVAIEKTEGLVKVLFDPETKEILGGHVVGADATELIHELLLAKSAELLPEDLATMVHAHPTLSESIMEVMRAVEGWVIHA